MACFRKGRSARGQWALYAALPAATGLGSARGLSVSANDGGLVRRGRRPGGEVEAGARWVSRRGSADRFPLTGQNNYPRWQEPAGPRHQAKAHPRGLVRKVFERVLIMTNELLRARRPDTSASRARAGQGSPSVRCWRLRETSRSTSVSKTVRVCVADERPY